MYRHPLVDINNINVPGQRICSHFLVQIPRADAEIKIKGNIFGYLYTNQTYIFFSYEIAEFRIQELFEPLFKDQDSLFS